MILPLVLLLLGSDASVARDWLEVEARLEQSDRVVLGEPFRLQLEAQHPPGRIAQLQEGLQLGPDFAERMRARTHQRSGGLVEIDRYEIELLAFRVGEVTLPPIRLTFGATAASSRPIPITVVSSLSPTEQLLPADRIETAPDPKPKRVFVLRDLTPLWLAVGIGLFFFVVIVLLLRRKPPTEESARAPSRPAHEEALAGLEQAEGVLSAGCIKAFYAELSLVLRSYVGARFGFASVELTLSELMRAIERRDTPYLDSVKLDFVLRAADQVKYAKYLPPTSDSESALQDARDLIRATIPKSHEGRHAD